MKQRTSWGRARSSELSWLHFPLQTNIPALTSQLRTSQGQNGRVSSIAKILAPFSVSAPISASHLGVCYLAIFQPPPHTIHIYIFSWRLDQKPRQYGKLMGHLPTPSPVEYSPLYQGQGRTGGEPAPESIVTKWSCSSQTLHCHSARIKVQCSRSKFREWGHDVCSRGASFTQKEDLSRKVRHEWCGN